MSERRTLLLSSGTQLQGLWPILAEKFDLVFLAPQVAQLAKEMQLAGASSLGEHLDNETQEAAANEAARVTARVVNAMLHIAARFAEAYAGLDAPTELTLALENWWAGYAMHYIREHTARMAAMERLMNSREVAGCLTHEDVTPDTRAMTLLCREFRIPTIHLPHAPCHLRPEAGQDIHREARTDWIAASGTQMKDWYVAQGFPAERIEIVGAPYWDGLYEGSLPEREEARQVLAIQPDSRVICYAGTWAQTTSLRGGFEREQDDGIAAALRLAQEWKAVVIVKAHPHSAKEYDDFYAKALEAAQVPGMVTRLHTNYCLRASDVLVAQGPSNMCLEAAALGTPSCYLQTEGFDFATELPPRGGPEELGKIAEEALRVASRDGGWREFVHAYNDAHPEGGAAERAAAFVEAVITDH